MLYLTGVLAMPLFFGILYMMSCALIAVVLRARRIIPSCSYYYGYAGFRTADLKAVKVKVSRERIIWAEVLE